MVRRAVPLTLALLVSTGLAGSVSRGSEVSLVEEVEERSAMLEGSVVAWRRDIHQHPELGNREHRTAALVAEHLGTLGYEVRTGVAHTGVVGVLRGGLPGGVVALRADMDALPVREQVDVPFASRVRAEYDGREVGVMHACGHDTHVAILMGVAEVLAGMRERLPGTVKLLFQPAEEGAPAGEEGGADLMIAEGALDDPRPEAIFGLHVSQGWPAGEVAVRDGGLLASAQSFEIRVRGRQTHAAQPWAGIDPVVVGAQIVLALQTIVSRQVDATLAPAVITVGTFHGGVRHNIIPDEIELTGTIRTFDPEMRREIHERMVRTVESIAAASGAEAEIEISAGVPVTYNDPELTRRMLPTLERVYGVDAVREAPRITGAEDFSFYSQEVPGLFFLIGGRPPAVPRSEAVPNHSPLFFVDESALPLAVRAMASLAVDFLLAP
jgi:amidohydrolase